MVILYAEDDPEDVEVFREAIKAIDSSIACIVVACIVAKDGIEALEVLENALILPDYIFLDVNMPLLDGRECLMRIRAAKEYSEIPVIIYTTSTRKNDITDFKSLGATEYVIKPNTFAEVMKYLSKILKA
jgi:CheY-like chemotaxis protein